MDADMPSHIDAYHAYSSKALHRGFSTLVLFIYYITSLIILHSISVVTMCIVVFAYSTDKGYWVKIFDTDSIISKML